MLLEKICAFYVNVLNFAVKFYYGNDKERKYIGTA